MPQFDNLHAEPLSRAAFKEALQQMHALKNASAVLPTNTLYINPGWQIDYARMQQEDPRLLHSLEQSAQENDGVIIVSLEILQSMIARELVVWIGNDN